MPLQFHTAQVLGLAAAGFHSGLQWTISYLAIPPILAAKDPKEKAALWKVLWTKGARTGPPAGLAASLSLAYVAYLTSDPDIRRIYSIAAVFPFLMMPYTFIAIEPTNQFLLGRAAAFDKGEDVKPEDDRQITEAVEKWRSLNYVRAAMPIVATAIAIAGLLS